MEDPLLPVGGSSEEVRGGWLEKVVDLEEAKVQVMFAIPMVVTNFSYYAIPLVSVMFAGHLGDVELAGATLGNSWATATGLALMTGLSGSLETLCGQNYGAKSYKMLGVHLQASILINVTFSILISILWLYTEPVLILLNQDPQTSKMAAIYLRFLIPGIFAYAFLQCLMRFLQTQRIVVPLVVCSVSPLLIHVGLTYTLVYVCNIGFEGTSSSAAISLWISVGMLLLYVNFSSRFHDTWQGLSTECFACVVPNMKLALPSAVMVCLDFWAFEFLVVLAGLLPNSHTSTSLIAMCVTTQNAAFNITYGFSAVISTRVSNELGARNYDRAKKAVGQTLKMSSFGTLVMVSLLLWGHDVWARFFSGNSLIIEEFAHMSPLVAVSLVLDSAQVVLSGVARGCGLQHWAAWTNLVGFYIVGMPLSLAFAFVLKLYVKGLWIGLICGLLCQGLIFLCITVRTKWEKLELYVEETDTGVNVH